MASKTVIGIDPGKTGGIATIYPDGKVALQRMPVISSNKRDVLDISELRRDFRLWVNVVEDEPVPHVFIEKQQPLPPKMGGSAANFQRGYNLGVLEALCCSLWLPYELVSPLRWQRLMLADVVGDDTKQRAILACDRLFPEVDLRPTERSKKPHGGLVDALLIAEYGRRRLAVRDE